MEVPGNVLDRGTAVNEIAAVLMVRLTGKGVSYGTSLVKQLRNSASMCLVEIQLP